MTNRRNQILTKWKAQLEDVKHVLRYLKTYPHVLSELDLENIISPHELNKHQKDWIDLYLLYEGMEKDFFHPFWVPINSTGYDYFIDLSDPNYPIFDTHYQWFDPPFYIRANIFDSINDLMLAEDRNIDIPNILEEAKCSLYGFDF